MVQIYIRDTLLDMPENYSITFSLINPAFSNDVLNRSFTTNFKIPRTPRNETVFNFATRFDHTKLKKEHIAYCYVEGLPFENGRLQIVDYDNDFIELYFTSDPITYNEFHSKKKIRDLVDGEFNVPGDNTHQYFIRLQQINGNWQYKITIGDKIFEGYYPTPTPTPTVVTDIANQINAVFPGVATATIPPLGISLFIDLTGMGFPIFTIDDNGGLFAQLEPPTIHSYDALQQMWVNYFINNKEPSDPDFKFPVFKNRNFYGGENLVWSDHVNFHRDGHRFNSNSFTDNDGFQYNLVPFIRNGLIIEKIAGTFNFTPIGIYNDIDFEKLHIYNTVSLDRIDWKHPDLFFNHPNADFKVNTYKHGFKFKDHIPDLTVKKYLTKLSEYLNLFYIYKDGLMNIVSRNDVIKSEAIDWSRKVNKKYNVGIENSDGYKIIFEERDNDDVLNDTMITESLELPSEDEYTLPSYPFYFLDEIDSSSPGSPRRRWKIPFVNEEGNSEFKVGTNNDYDFRLFMYHGLIDDIPIDTPFPVPYPFASSDSIDVNGNSIGNTILDLSAVDESILNKYWIDWINKFNNADKISFQTLLGITDIVSLDWEKPMRYIVHENGMMCFIISKIDFTVKDCGITSSKVDGYSIKSK